MRVLTSLLVTALLFGVPASKAADADEPVTFKVSEDPQFANYRIALAQYLRSRHVTRGAHACVLGEKSSDGSRLAWVIWPDGHRMILWDGDDSALSASRRILDLRKDVVSTEAQVAGSTYLVTRQWVAQQQERCGRLGISFQITAAELKK